MYCSNCASEIPEDNTFCESCGTEILRLTEDEQRRRVSAANSTIGQSTTPVTGPMLAHPPRVSKFTNPSLALAAAILIGMCVIGFLSVQLLTEIRDHNAEAKRRRSMLTTISRQICINTATSERHRGACIGDLLE